jgi:hypothetical protein
VSVAPNPTPPYPHSNFGACKLTSGFLVALVPVAVLALCEPCVDTISASLPVIKPLWTTILRAAGSSLRSARSAISRGTSYGKASGPNTLGGTTIAGTTGDREILPMQQSQMEHPAVLQMKRDSRWAWDQGGSYQSNRSGGMESVWGLEDAAVEMGGGGPGSEREGSRAELMERRVGGYV